MAAGLAITGITKDLVFSTRRADRAISSDNVAVSIGNADVAAGQVKNAIDGVKELSKASNTGCFTNFQGAENAIKMASEGSDFMKGLGKVVNFTADHINPVITAIGGVKVLCAEDKKEALIDEGCALGTMFAFEGIAKNTLEMAKKVKDPVTKQVTMVKRNALYKKNPFLKAQSEKIEKAIVDYCDTKKLFDTISLKHAPGIIKGLLFVGASIAGYNLGLYIGKKINKSLKENKSDNSTKESVNTTSAQTA